MHNQPFEEWDPLSETGEVLAPDYIARMKKQEIKNIVKSYAGFYDLFAELIQNAFDAVDDRAEIQKGVMAYFEELKEKGYKDRWWRG